MSYLQCEICDNWLDTDWVDFVSDEAGSYHFDCYDEMSIARAREAYNDYRMSIPAIDLEAYDRDDPKRFALERELVGY